MKILHKTITTDTQITATDCYLIGATMGAACDSLLLYDETTNTKTAAQLCLELGTNVKSVILPLPGKVCDGIYADIDHGRATIYYYF